MKLRLPPALRTTTFKLAMVYSAMFLVFSAVLLAYLYSQTVLSMQNEAELELTNELVELGNAYRDNNFERLEQSVFERMNTNGQQFIYYLEDASGSVVAGQLRSMPFETLSGPEVTVPFEIEFTFPDGKVQTSPAAARALDLVGGGRLLVGYFTSQQNEIVARIQNAMLIAAPAGVILSLLGGWVISRGAASRADELARTAEAVMGGDYGRRAPVRGSNDEFDRLGMRMNDMLDQIEKLMDATRNTGNAIAHDLRSPLSRLKNKLQSSLANPMTADEASATLTETMNEVDHVLDTFNSILRIARLDAGAEGTRQRTNVGDIAEELSELFEPAFEDADLSFKSQISKNQTVLGDKGLLAQAIVNLLDNAVKYTPKGGHIELKVKRSGDNHVDISVADTGPGIPADSRERVTERFERLDSARTQPGSGLGLALVSAVADMHSGELILKDGKTAADPPGLKAVLRLPRI